MPDHILSASAETCHWGCFDATYPAVLSVQSGDRVTIHSVSGAETVLPPAGFHVPPELPAIHAHVPRHGPGHILTGPVAIAGARPGHVLQVEIEAVRLRQDWGWNMIRPGAGTIPDDFPHAHLTNIPLDRTRMTGRMPWGLDLPLAPFFGVMGVAPPAAWGRVSTIEPRANGGNLDCKELVAGTVLYLPVHVEGALFSCGDGHGCQGDGEVCLTAIETALQGTFKLTLRDDMALDMPRAETPSHLITFGIDADLNEGTRQALRAMIALLVERAGITREQAYMLCSLAADLRITQTVNGNKGVHCMIAREYAGG